ncbi:MAG TPA: phosphoribosylformylglycinamidine cyclo-ligase [Candidatus Omnitrophica bacterium]|nr:MAG: phosphoribosylformylglycinamidine cyclo-ligase [Omnitrophica WOR_2 bacterium GWA2_45_18]OGX18501.1 MAG: phosphoribosylformylglycinamidine cyclo-ligase [Omnitrophica WOR_2 bacterium GWC2_45_7]HBR14433.1 phosphoribosylformylglycinamidine cyclo-ligase [Candidatus Omnitrophota bacterium]
MLKLKNIPRRAEALSYKSSGVDIAKANAFVKAIGPDIAGTLNPSVIQSKGAFAGLFSLDRKKYKNPVLVSSTDGVGTKLLVAKSIGKHDTVGIDLVAMNVNDILCVGAQPLFFLDYIACGKVDVKILKAVIKGIAAGCRQAGCSLIGGETAEMPGLYAPDEYDLAGFAVGVVERNRIIDGAEIKAGDRLIGLPSSGLHSNGFSLVRKVFSLIEQKKLAKELLKPTRIYAKEVTAVVDQFPPQGKSSAAGVKGIAHITGGAFYEKLTKILPDGKCFIVDKKSWPVPEIFQRIQEKGNVRDEEMYRTFNMGIGLAFVFNQEIIPSVKAFLAGQKIKHYEIGEVGEDVKRKIIFSS